MSDRLRVGVAQCNATPVVADNVAGIVATLEEMARDRVELACFPENATLLAPDTQRLALAEPLGGAQMAAVQAAADRLSMYVLLGSVVEEGPDAGHSFNTSVLIGPSGEVEAVYRKMHLFDVEVASDTSFRESDTVAAGPPTPVLADVRGWSVGLSICYDLRFPELYRALVAAGAEVLAIPAAFTFRTGAAHWDVLLRARAIENLAYVVAPAQVGRHYGSRESYGHAMVVGPWGEVMAQVAGGVGWSAADLSRGALESARRAIPCLTSRRM